MEALFIYLGKMILCSAIMFSYYHLALRNRTFHHYNRFYLLFAVVASLLLPLLKISYFTIEVNSDIQSLFTKFKSINPTKTNADDFIYYRLIIFIAGLASVFILGRFFFGFLKIRTYQNQFPKEKVEGISFYRTDLENAPFSFFRNLFWKNSILLNSDLGLQILKHEMVHIEQKHTYDKIFMEITTGVLWFNPVFWFIKKEINLIHEYLADKKAVRHMDTKAFAQMLLASHFSGKVLPATSPFISSNLKKRLKMLQKPKTKFGYAHRILTLPFVFTMVFVYAVNTKNKEIRTYNSELSLQNIKQDTAKANNAEKIRQEIQRQQAETYPLKEQLRLQAKKTNALNEKIRKKHSKLKVLENKKDFDNPRYAKLSKEINQLNDKVRKIYEAKEYKEGWAKHEKHFSEMDGLFAKLDDTFKSEDFHKRIQKAEHLASESQKMMDSPEFKKQMKAADRAAKQAEKIYKQIESPDFQKKLKDAEANGKQAEKKAAEVEKMINSPEFQQRIKNAEKQAEEAVKKSEKLRKNTAFSVFSTGNTTYIFADDRKPKVFVDGIEENWDEAKKIAPNAIERMIVKKTNEIGGEIHIFKKIKLK